MSERKNRPTRDELIKQLSSRGWALDKGDKDRTLEELVRTAHTRHKKGQTPGTIHKIEDTIELDLIELEGLWVHLGLPM